MTTPTQDSILVACARAAHEVNRAYCIAIGDEMMAWEQAPDWQRESVLKGVRGVLLEGNGPRESHACWLAEKAATGWKYGPIKDIEKKEHPCFVEYDALPDAQRHKDTLFVGTVRTLAAALGFSLPNTRLSMKAVEE